ncbi:hypothetical protein DLM85_11845 [Hymenobacter edaphi]|uniref:Uncharacterized protein n=2 Tax=Hymenobacter edaphi TaxID=2211146 RepID=A0A328BJR1_9BACT|nr:hypothetical protein DLM85_11845 [Hymenobacter edaphi]
MLGISEEALEDGEVAIYMENSLNLESEVRLFEAAETDDLLEFQKDGVQYRYMLEANLAAELLEGAKGSGPLAKAERVLHYAIYDA